VIGNGAAGVELAFAFKVRWGKFFGQEIDVTLYSSNDKILGSESERLQKSVLGYYEKMGIKVEYNVRVAELTEEGIKAEDGRFFNCLAPIWATGAEAHP
jgi:NADH dehydrogenase FAD-containing subunit